MNPKLCTALLSLGILGSTMASSPQAPLIIIRQGGSDSLNQPVNAKLMEWNQKYPGFCDELWMLYKPLGRQGTIDGLAKVVQNQREAFTQSNIRLSIQGYTLGHTAMTKAQSEKIFESIPEEAWQVSDTGARLYGLFCPRSPFTLQLQQELLRETVNAVHPVSYWLDDDLRLGIKKPNGCFCDRCLAEFNRENGTALTREELAKRLFGEAELEPLRAKWSKFNAESLAIYAKACREAADEVDPNLLLAYQSVWADCFYTADDYLPMLNALGGKNGNIAGIRPGASYYSEWYPKEILFTKVMSIIRESERLRTANFTGQICYEEENYPRKIVNKSPEAIMWECALMLAAGCDSLSLYWYNVDNAEPLAYYERFAKTVSQYRPYFELLAASSRRTRLGGMARFAGARRLEHKSWNLMEECEMWLSQCAIPYTVAEADPGVWWATKRTVGEMVETDFDAFFAKPSVMTLDAFTAFAKTYPALAAKTFVNCPPEKLTALYRKAVQDAKLYFVNAAGEVGVLAEAPTVPGVPAAKLRYGGVVTETASGKRCAVVWTEYANYMLPVYNERAALLDALDAVAGNAVPVRTDYYQALRLFPRINRDGKVDTLTIFNCSTGQTEAFEIAIRNPLSSKAFWIRPCAEPVALNGTFDEVQNELRVTLPEIPGSQCGTVVFR